MQSYLQSIGWMFLIAGGILLAIYAISQLVEQSPDGRNTEARSKGVIFLGPFPIVWGFGKQGWIIAGVVAIVLFIIWLIYFI